MEKPSYPLVFELKFPIAHGDEELKVINYRRPIAKDLRSVKPENMTFGDLLDLFAKMSDQAPPIINELDGEDAIAAVTLVSDFLGGGQKTKA